MNLFIFYYSANMDTVYRYLPLTVVIIFAIMVSSFQANAQTYPIAEPIQYENLSASNFQPASMGPSLQVNPLWGLAVLLIPIGYFLRNRLADGFPKREPIARGYTIAYQDIRRSKKKKETKTVKNPKAM